MNNWLNFPLHRRVHSTVYSVLSECLWKKEVVGSNPTWVAGEVFSQTLGKHQLDSAVHTSV